MFFVAETLLQNRTRLNQNGLVRFQIFVDGFNAVDGIGDADGIRFSQFVMHQQFAHHGYPENCLSHTPDLTICQRLLMRVASECFLDHARVYTGLIN